MTIYLNHVGYTPGAAKTVLMGGMLETDFEVCEISNECENTAGNIHPSNLVVYRGELRRVTSDFGQYTRGDFSPLQTPGTYVIRAGREASNPFRIGSEVYNEAVEKICGYFKLQRCGDSQHGWNGPCHLDDGLRGDTRQRQDVTGGWHDACDLRKWVSATIYAMLGLAELEPFTSRS